MAKTYLLPQNGRFYKANLHAHSTVSDGRWSPEQVKAEYQKRGYSILSLTDHNQYRWHPDLNDGDFVCLAGYEANINNPEDGPLRLDNRGKTYHLNFYDTRPEARPAGYQPPATPGEEAYGDMAAINAWLREMQMEGFLGCYNHPYWSLQDKDDYVGLRHLFAMEIYNHGCELDGMYGYHPQAFDEMLAAGCGVFPLATDDNHNVFAPGDPLCDSFGGITMVKAPQLTYGAVVEALQKGDFYATFGPEIYELYVEDGVLSIKCSPAEKIFVKSAGRACLRATAKPGKEMSEAAFPLEGLEMPFRVDVRDTAGHHACTRAYSL